LNQRSLDVYTLTLKASSESTQTSTFKTKHKSYEVFVLKFI